MPKYSTATNVEVIISLICADAIRCVCIAKGRTLLIDPCLADVRRLRGRQGARDSDLDPMATLGQDDVNRQARVAPLS